MNNDNDKSVLRVEKKTKNAQAKPNVRWRKRLPHNVDSEYKGDNFDDPPDELWTPKQYFDNFFDKSIYEHIAEQTNLYSVQVTGNSIKIDENEIQQFIGILTLMGILKYPQYRMYWSQFTRCSSINEIMSMKRFETITRFFHVSDNNEMPKKGEPDFDLLYKVRPIVNFLFENCRKIQQEEC